MFVFGTFHWKGRKFALGNIDEKRRILLHVCLMAWCLVYHRAVVFW